MTLAGITELSGKRFGRLVVQNIAIRKQTKSKWECRCDCGKTAIISSDKLLSGHTQSCGCLIEYVRIYLLGHSTHGHTKNGRSPEYRSFRSMIGRCEDRENASYVRYGKVGIKVCKRWRNNFEIFLSDMGPKPSPKHTIDRKDALKDYEPDNCRWATSKEQARHRRNAAIVVYNGQKVTLAELAEQRGLRLEMVRKRINRDGWSLEEALRPPLPTGQRRS